MVFLRRPQTTNPPCRHSNIKSLPGASQQHYTHSLSLCGPFVRWWSSRRPKAVYCDILSSLSDSAQTTWTTRFPWSAQTLNNCGRSGSAVVRPLTCTLYNISLSLTYIYMELWPKPNCTVHIIFLCPASIVSAKQLNGIFGFWWHVVKESWLLFAVKWLNGICVTFVAETAATKTRQPQQDVISRAIVRSLKRICYSVEWVMYGEVLKCCALIWHSNVIVG